MGKACSGFGSSNSPESIMPQLMEYLEKAIELGCDTFYLGEYGQFDHLMSRATAELKKKYPNIERICVIPYITKTMQDYKEEYYQKYDAVLLPEEVDLCPARYSILKKNEWVVKNSDVIITGG